MLIKDHREERISLHLQQEQETVARSGAQKQKAAKIRKQKEAQTSNNNSVSPQETQPNFCDGAAATDVVTAELYHTLEEEPLVSSAPLQALQKSSWKNCCGLLELFRAMTDNLSWLPDR